MLTEHYILSEVLPILNYSKLWVLEVEFYCTVISNELKNDFFIDFSVYKLKSRKR